MSIMKINREHEIHCGHRVVGHEGKCRNLHGHGYVIHFTCEADNGKLDNVGRVIDFGEVKSKLCMWLEDHWDHKFIVWEKDYELLTIANESINGRLQCGSVINNSFVFVPFNPTAENMAQYLVDVIGPQQLNGTGITLTSVTIEETRKCSVSYGN